MSRKKKTEKQPAPDSRSFLLLLRAERRGKKVTMTVQPLASTKTMYATIGFPEEVRAVAWHRKITRDAEGCLTALYKALKGKMA